MKQTTSRDFVLGLLVLLLVSLTVVVFSRFMRPAEEKPTQLYELTSYDTLPGWAEADSALSLTAFQRSCSRIKWKNPERNLGPKGNAGPIQVWQAICKQAKDWQGDPRLFFETHFEPYQVLVSDAQDNHSGIFTGYYEPALTGARLKEGPYQSPIYKRPDDLVMVDLGQFRDDLRGRRIAGLVKDGTLKPYADRAEIDEGALTKKGEPFIYLDSAIDSFFLHIQGSGRVKLPDGSSIRLAYDGQNGHPYRAIGRDLIEMGAVKREDMSMEAIRNWLADNPDQAQGLMQKNPSYIFFREEAVTDPTIGPKGAANVPLTPGYSLAVDRKYHAMGLPVWLNSTLPDGTSFKRLMIAQDTGGAIRGPVRGDVFFGFGEEAARLAGEMKQKGQMIALLPKALRTLQTAQNK